MSNFDYDEDDMTDVRGQSSADLTAAYEKLKKVDLSVKMFASGINVHLRNLEGAELTHPFCIHGEDFKPVQDALLVALKRSLERRSQALTYELKSVNTSLGIIPQ